MFADANLFAIFTTGLLTGGLTCVAVQGGLLSAALLQKDRSNPFGKLSTSELRIKGWEKLVPILAFIFAKLIAYTLLGFFLGWLGSMLQVSIQTRIILQFVIVVFMLGTALNLLNVHPFFRYFVIMPPRFFTNLAYKNSKYRGLFAPTLLGLLTVFIPCGATQAMMALAVASGSAVIGGLIMFIFVLGTSPVFLLLGLATVGLKSKLNKQFIKIAALAIILLSLFNLDATLALANSPYTMRSVLKDGFCVISYCDPSARSGQVDPVVEQTITFTPTGYSPNHFAIRKGGKVTLRLANENASGCIQAFTISALNIQKIVLPNKTEEISFIAPDTPRRITFTCSAGLYPGTIEVI